MVAIPGMENATVSERLGVDLARAQNELVRRLRQRRVDLDLTASEVAAKMEVDPSFVSRFERGGTNATFSTIRRYAKAVDSMVTYKVEARSDHRKRVVSERADAIIGSFRVAEDLRQGNFADSEGDELGRIMFPQAEANRVDGPKSVERKVCLA